VTPFASSHHGPTLAQQVRTVGVGAAQPAAGLAIVLAGGAFMALLAVPAYASACLAARRHPTLRADLAAAFEAEADEDREIEEAERRYAAALAAASAPVAATGPTPPMPASTSTPASVAAEPEAVTVAA
jgi:hypothetical protein